MAELYYLVVLTAKICENLTVSFRMLYGGIERNVLYFKQSRFCPLWPDHVSAKIAV